MLHENNRLGLNGFDFVEFSADDPTVLTDHFERLGFVYAAQHPTRDVRLYVQNDARVLINAEKKGHGAAFAKAHGPSASGMAFRVKDPKTAYEFVMARGAKPADEGASALGEGAFVIEGIGGANLYLTADPAHGQSTFAHWYEQPNWQEKAAQNNVGLNLLDHLTHNLKRGQMKVWSDYYAHLFGFSEQKYFNIKGKATGLFSQAMMAPDLAIRIPLNESQDEASQIEEFIRDYRGEGIQHLAFTTDDIYQTVEALRARGVVFQDTLDTYYDQVEKRVPNHGENLERMRQNRILIDGNVGEEGLLLQIFTVNLFGPIFLEIIQRKGNDGFGNGNFQALFESIELDQIRRGVIKA